VVYQAEFQFFKDSSQKEVVFPNETLAIDSSQLSATIRGRLFELYELGFLAAENDLLVDSSGKVLARFYTNEVFDFAKLRTGNVAEEILSKVGYDARAFLDKPFSHQKTVKLLNSVLDYAENHGYPFASIRLDSIKFSKNSISAQLNYQSGPLIVFDSLLIDGYNKVKPKYLMTHLGIYPGEPYEEKLIREISNKMKLLPFVALTETPITFISNGKCNIQLALAQKKVSKLDGVLGVLPNEKDGGSVLITGQLNLDLYNLFSSGKRLAIEWQNYNENSQLLDASYYHPNLFRTPVHIGGDFHLLKQDTTFINRQFSLELSILSKGSSKVGFKTDFISSRLISTIGYDQISTLPENTDYNLNYYGLNYSLKRFDNLFLPTSGWGFDIIGSAGQKKIIENPAFNDDIYKGIDLESFQLRIAGSIDKYWGIYKNMLLRTRLTGGYLEGDNLFQSDLFRIGGLQSLRGFVENQFFASSYGIANVEFRAMFSELTYFMLFYDQAVLREGVSGESVVDYPFGTGAGFSFSTMAGIFNFVFAMGKSNTQEFGFEFSKIHFGYISRF